VFTLQNLCSEYKQSSNSFEYTQSEDTGPNVFLSKYTQLARYSLPLASLPPIVEEFIYSVGAVDGGGGGGGNLMRK